MYPGRRHAVKLHVVKMQSCHDEPPTTTAAPTEDATADRRHAVQIHVVKMREIVTKSSDTVHYKY